MLTHFEVYFKFAENGSYSPRAMYPTLPEAMASTHLGNPAEAYTDPVDWHDSGGETMTLATRITDQMRRSSPWLIEKVQIPENDAERIELAASVGFEYGRYDGDHHKMWVIDQMLRILLGDRYEEQVVAFKSGEDGPETYSWDTGIAP